MVGSVTVLEKCCSYSKSAGTKGKVCATFIGTNTQVTVLVTHGIYRGTHSYTISKAKGIGLITKVIISTFSSDDLEIARISVQMGSMIVHSAAGGVTVDGSLLALSVS